MDADLLADWDVDTPLDTLELALAPSEWDMPALMPMDLLADALTPWDAVTESLPP